MRYILLPLCLALVGLGCGDEDAPVTLDECGDFEEGTDLNVCTATYLGDSDGMVVAVETDSEGRQWVAGNFDEPPVELEEFGTGEAMVLELSVTGGELRGGLRFDGELMDMAVDAETDALAVATDAGVAVVQDADIMWEVAVDGVDRIDIDDSKVVTLAGDRVRLFDDNSETSFEIDVERSSVRDVAVHAASQRVFITGYDQVSGNLQQPFLFAYDFDGQRAWTGWDWSSEEAGDLSSDTRGTAVSVGLDGKLYYIGESHGGVTTHFRMPDDIDEEAPLVRRDDYSQSHNWNGAAPLGFVARLEPESGELESGQLLAVRLSDGRGNGVSPTTVSAREDGTMLLGGGSACCIEDWEDRKVAGEVVMPGYGGGAWVMVLTNDFSDRPLWTTFGAPDSSVAIADVSARGEAMAVVQNQTPSSDHDSVQGQLVTEAAMQSSPPGALASPHLTVFPGP